MNTRGLPRRGLLLGLAAAAAGREVLAGGRAAAAGAGGPIRIVVAYPAGGVSDAIARALAEALSQQLARRVLVENRGGAGGALAVQWVARSRPDGDTLCFAAATALLPHPGSSRSGSANSPGPPLVPVAGVMRTPTLVVGTPALPARTLRQLLALARARPGQVRWATTGEGTSGYLLLRAIRQGAGVSITHIPYKGGAQQVNDALASQFEVLSTNVAPLQLQAIRAGRLHPLAVGAPARVASLPEVPTLAELGFPQANLVSLFGLFAPRGTPAERIGHLNREVGIALRGPPLRDRLLAASNQPVHGTPAEFEAQVRQALRLAVDARQEPATHGS